MNEERERQLALAIQNGNVSASHVNDTSDDAFAGFSAATREAQEQHALSLKLFESKQRQHKIQAPTNDEEVKSLLRAHGHPICLFGERAMDRRDRLKSVLAQEQVEHELIQPIATVTTTTTTSTAKSSSTLFSRNKKAFFTQASNELIVARQRIASNSWERAKNRLVSLQQLQQQEMELPSIHNGNQIAALNEPRPISTCRFSEKGDRLITSSFDGSIRVYNESFTMETQLLGHEHRLCDAIFCDSDSRVIASGSAEGEVRVWNLSSSSSNSCRSVLTGHVQRIGRLAAIPNFPSLLCSTSFDRTFRLWDLETEQCLLLQDGHAREIYACSVHPDGSLLCTADLGSVIRVWDLRCGTTTHVFQGHTLGVLCAEFSKKGTLLATGSLDHTVRLWDLRKSQVSTILAAHMQPVTSVRFDSSSSLLCTTSQDRSLGMWCLNTNKRLFHKERLHEGPILGMDWNRQKIATCGYDRSVKCMQVQ